MKKQVTLRNIKRGQCYYSVDAGPDMKCCGEKTLGNYSYCEKHCDIIFNYGWRSKAVNK